MTADFDPMLAKLVVHGADRAQAADRAIEALGRLSMLGVTTNIDYLMRVLASPGFRDSAPNTGFVAENAAALAAPAVEPQARDAVLAAAALGLPEFRKLIFEVPDLHAAIGHWRN